ncbi:hypothetical protein [Roseiconus lacunae]|uniref:Secreted protein n=1 Tax=Roseiconus lacunae TaxID=2605694 RepID=A0ABT7PMX0_9BACT|nr:hypothetical protein [Roseiconus lacunae]MDM4017629.1 hypothetical protein [Roseiconus lacunae]
MNAQFRRLLAVGILCLPCGVSSVSGQQFEPADEEPAKPAAPPSLPPEPSSAEEDAEDESKKLDFETLLNRKKLPKDEDGKSLPSWPIETLQQILNGEIQLEVNGKSLRGYVTETSYDRTGRPVRLTRVAPSTINPSASHSIERVRIGIIQKIEQQLTDVKKELLDDKRTDEQSVILDDLRFLYQLRFDLDTAYQDLKVSEIETRAKKLREEIERREAAVEKWVDAKITLDKMKADGIDVGGATFLFTRPELSSSSSYPAPTRLAIPTHPDPNQAVPSLAPSLPTFQAQ